MKKLMMIVSCVAVLGLAFGACDSGDDDNGGGDKDVAAQEEGDTGGGEEADTGGGEEPGDFTSATACSKIFECLESNFGFASEAECVELYAADCQSADGFLGCVKACIAEHACDAFTDCEPACWDNHCKQ